MAAWLSKNAAEEESSSSSGDESSSAPEEPWIVQLVWDITTSDRFVLLVSTVIVFNVFVISLQATWPNVYWPPACASAADAIEQMLVAHIVGGDKDEAAWQLAKKALARTTDLEEGFDVREVVAAYARKNGCLSVWSLANLAFLGFFSLEVTFRIITYRFAFFCGADKGWNLFDLFIVLVGCGDKVMGLVIGHQRSSTPLVTTLRVVRVLRILRVLRVFKTFRKLSLLLRGLVESFGIISWICVLMSMFMISYAILTTTLIGQVADEFEDPESVRMYFGSVYNSTFTLFQCLTLDNWSVITRLVWDRSPYFVPLIIFYIIAISLVVVSLLSGIMAEHMNTVRALEEEREERLTQTKMKAAIDLLLIAFKRVDIDDDNLIDLDEFSQLLQDAEMLEELAKIELDLSLGEEDAQSLFNSFDRDHDGVLTWSEFKDGMNAMKKRPLGVGQVLQLQTLQRALRTGDGQGEGRNSPEVLARIKDNVEMAGGVQRLLDDIDEELHTFVHELREQHRQNHRHTYAPRPHAE